MNYVSVPCEHDETVPLQQSSPRVTCNEPLLWNERRLDVPCNATAFSRPLTGDRPGNLPPSVETEHQRIGFTSEPTNNFLSEFNCWREKRETTTRLLPPVTVHTLQVSLTERGGVGCSVSVGRLHQIKHRLLYVWCLYSPHAFTPVSIYAVCSLAHVMHIHVRQVAPSLP